jgi:hypothetical protein
MMAGKILHTEDVERDGMSYRVVVYRSYDGYWAAWTCPICEVGGATPAAVNVEKAVEIARSAILAGHHIDAHAHVRAKWRPS